MQITFPEPLLDARCYLIFGSLLLYVAAFLGLPVALARARVDGDGARRWRKARLCTAVHGAGLLIAAAWAGCSSGRWEAGVLALCAAGALASFTALMLGTWLADVGGLDWRAGQRWLGLLYAARAVLWAAAGVIAAYWLFGSALATGLSALM